MIERRIPRPSDFAELLKFQRPSLDRTGARLARAHTIADLRKIAKRVTPRAPFDYTDGAAEGELSLARARQAYEDVEFHPAILRDVSDVDTAVSVTGGPSALPFGIAPTGFTRMMHTAGERAGAAAAGAAGIPFSLSTVGTATPEEVAAANRNGRNWFQLYMWKDRERSMDVLDRAAAAGFDTLLVTVDVPVAGARLRDRYNGLTIPPTLTGRTVLNAIPRVRWWVDFLTTEPIGFSTFKEFDGTVAELLDSMFDPSVDYDDLLWIKDRWSGPVVVKGVQTLEDAKRCADLGVDAVLLSNHGGRQLDRAPVPFHLLPAVRRQLPRDIEVWVDTGIMSGADIVAAIAQGATFTLVGRAYLYGLMAGGRRGVDRAIQILSDEVVRTMKLLGVRSVADLEPGHVTQLTRRDP
jgi:isopentenyl diphosphate isomerase/L-lactate dehydrogenase-like FMN-dependent dehydrogenase